MSHMNRVNLISLLNGVLQEVKPKDMHIEQEAAIMLRRINAQLKKDRIKAVALTGGSIAKGTYLAYDHDCDIFVQFDMKYADRNLSDLLEPCLHKLFPGLLRLHGSRDYFQVQNKLNFELVPVLAVKKPEQAVNITDCSPFHVRWVKKFPKLADDIRLTRAFCKANGVYGAESYIKGFSGHMIDIITIHYGGFLKLLEAARKWKDKTVVDHYKIHKGKALRHLNRSKITSPLIVIDPVEPSRNAAASLDKEKFNCFIRKAGEFLKRPSKEYFIKHDFSLELLKQKAKGKKLVALSASPLEGKEDVIGAKLLKVFEFIQYETRQYGFTLHDAGWHWDKGSTAVFYYILEKKPLPATYIREGPLVEMEAHAAAFKKAHKKTFVEKSKLCAIIEREYVLPENFIKHLLGAEYVKTKIKKIKIVYYG